MEEIPAEPDTRQKRPSKVSFRVFRGFWTKDGHLCQMMYTPKLKKPFLATTSLDNQPLDTIMQSTCTQKLDLKIVQWNKHHLSNTEKANASRWISISAEEEREKNINMYVYIYIYTAIYTYVTEKYDMISFYLRSLHPFLLNPPKLQASPMAVWWVYPHDPPRSKPPWIYSPSPSKVTTSMAEGWGVWGAWGGWGVKGRDGI